MKRIFSIFFAFSLAITMMSSGLSTTAFASSVNTSAEEEKTTETTTVNLLETGDSKESDDADDSSSAKKESVVIPDTGASYGLDGMSGSPDITAASAIVMDARSGAILYSKKADTKRYPASITKVMTALIAIENCSMDEIVEYTDSAVNGIEDGSSTAGINVGAQLTMEESLYALMLVSANEAAAAIAEHISGSDEEFAKLMTERAAELGCTNTNFKNPHGLPDEEHYTTAHDMGLIMKEAIKHEEFRKISSTINYTLKNDTLKESIDLWNHAKILRKNSEYYYKRAVGAKTGYTRAALNTLVTYAEKDGSQLLCVILRDQGADRSYIDTKNLFKWGFDQVKSITPLKNYDINLAISSLEGLSDKQVETYQSLNAVFNADYPICVKKDFDESSISCSFRLDEDIDSGRLGLIDVSCGEDLIVSLPVTYDTSSDAARNYQIENGAGDDVKTADVSNTSALIRKIIGFLIRLVIACALIFVIMQFIHRRQLEKNRQERIKRRQSENHTPGQSTYNGRKRSSSSRNRRNSSQNRTGQTRNSRSSSGSNSRNNNNNRNS